MAALEKEMLRLRLSKETVLQSWGCKKGYYTEQKEEAKSEEERFPYKVMYDDGTVSWIPLEGKKPWGVFILEDECLCIQKAKIVASHNEACEIAERTFVGKHNVTLPSRLLFNELRNKSKDELNELCNFMELLGGASLECEDLWSSCKTTRSDDGWPRYLTLAINHLEPVMWATRYISNGYGFRKAVLLSKKE